jgi:pyridoxal phosphate enzyme (YggS family)
VAAASLRTLLAERLADVEARLNKACERASRSRADVMLVAVTKHVPVEVAALLPELGYPDLGESRPQALWQRAAVVPQARWHLVGHLQRNKVKNTLPLVQWIHSVDSVRLLKCLEEEAVLQGRTINVLLEVNTSREANKHGVQADELPGLLANLADLRLIHVRGLMTMAALADDPEQCRPTFAALRQLRDRFQRHIAAPHDLLHLSMGMSQDFEVAIAEGATMVRLGTVLFEGLSL